MAIGRAARILTLAVVALAVFATAGCAEQGVKTNDAKTYAVVVAFSESYTQDDIEAVRTFLSSYDEDLEFNLQESFPPVARASLRTPVSSFCDEFEREMAGESILRSLSCTEALSDSSGQADGNDFPRDGVKTYAVGIAFSESYAQDDIEAVRAFLSSYDEDLEFDLQESFPPVARASVRTPVISFCEEFEREMGREPFLRSLSCTEAPEDSAEPTDGGDLPVP